MKRSTNRSGLCYLYYGRGIVMFLPLVFVRISINHASASPSKQHEMSHLGVCL